MPGTFSPPPRVSDPDMHHGICVMHMPWCMPGSLTSGFLWNRWRGKRSRHSRRMRNPQFYVSDETSCDVIMLQIRHRLLCDVMNAYLVIDARYPRRHHQQPWHQQFRKILSVAFIIGDHTTIRCSSLYNHIQLNKQYPMERNVQQLLRQLYEAHS